MIVTNPDFEAIARKYGLTTEYVRQMWTDMFEYIHDEACSFNIIDTTEEELDAMKTDFLLPAFGFLRLNRRRVRNRRPSLTKSRDRAIAKGFNKILTSEQLRESIAKKREKYFNKNTTSCRKSKK